MLQEETRRFKPIEMENAVLNFWAENNIYAKSKKGTKPFTFIDGPPYPTGAIHVGTAWNKSMKDAVLRYKRMNDYMVRDTPGFDMHGLPVEVKVEKKLGIHNKKAIEEYGIANFVNACRDFAGENMGVMCDQFKRLGVWMDWEKPYLTTSNSYIEGCWWAIKEAHKNSHLYKGKKVLTVCPRCETTLAKHEQEYKTVEENSIYVKLPLVDKKNEYLLIWTTTPWTIPNNLAVMASPEIEYVKISVDGEFWWIASDLVAHLMGAIDKSYEVVERVKGNKLAGLKYTHPLEDEMPIHKDMDRKYEAAHTVLMSAEHVTTEAGTGMVHCAPGNGPEDYAVGTAAGLPAFCPMHKNGIFTKEGGKYAGTRAKKTTDPLVIEDLSKKGLLLHTEAFEHEYPICWRCKSALIFLATEQWFLGVSKLKDKMIKQNKNVHWIPDWAGNAWFNSWLENIQDWCISHQRYWGVPIPIWTCEKCGAKKVIGSSDELPTIPKDLHRPWIDEVKIPCECGGEMTRIEDITDVWLESGAAVWASQGFPANADAKFPADFIIEGKDQIRGWFNTLMSLSMASKGQAPYKNVFMHGFVNDQLGRKMSKSLGNYIKPDEVVEKYGADAFRLFSIGATNPGEDMAYGDSFVQEAQRAMNIFWNVYAFGTRYMVADNFDPLAHDLKDLPLTLEDKWILSRLASTNLAVTDAFESYELPKIPKALTNFMVEDLSRWYIKLIRNRTWVSVKGDDKLAAYATLYRVIERFLRILAPVTPMFAEEIYQKFVRPVNKEAPESVHLESWPLVEWHDKELERDMKAAKAIVDSTMFARQEIGINLRRPLLEIVVEPKDDGVSAACQRLSDLILSMTNVKAMRVMNEFTGGVEYSEFPESSFNIYINKSRPTEIVAESVSRDLIRAVQVARKKSGLHVGDRIKLAIHADAEIIDLLENFVGDIEAKASATIDKLEHELKGTAKTEKGAVEFSFEKEQ